MTADQPPPAAVQIALAAMHYSPDPRHAAEDAVAALVERWAFVDHAEYARLVAVEQAARIYSESTRDHAYGNPNQTWRDLNDALAVAPAGTAARTYDQLTEQEDGPPNDRINERPAGAGLPRFCP